MPDFIPVIGYADDAIIVAVRAAVGGTSRGGAGGSAPLARHRDGFAALCRLTGLTPDEAPGPAGQPPARADSSPGNRDTPPDNLVAGNR